MTEGLKAQSPWQHLKGQIYLGDERFVMKMQAKLTKQTADITFRATTGASAIAGAHREGAAGST